MARRRNKGIGGYEDWQVQFLLTGEVPPDDDPDVNVFEVLDWKYHTAVNRGDPVKAAWEALRDHILPDWIRRHPGSRPFAWWCFDSGLERKCGPMRLTDRIVAKNVRYSLRDSIPEDQRAWLAEHGHLQPGE